MGDGGIIITDGNMVYWVQRNAGSINEILYTHNMSKRLIIP
jgi:hypothetical protein